MKSILSTLALATAVLAIPQFPGEDSGPGNSNADGLNAILNAASADASDALSNVPFQSATDSAAFSSFTASNSGAFSAFAASNPSAWSSLTSASPSAFASWTWPYTTGAPSITGSVFASITSAAGNATSASGKGPWAGGAPFGPGGWGPFASGVSGSAPSGPWSSWWGSTVSNGCPASMWSGWTSGPWGELPSFLSKASAGVRWVADRTGTNPPWTSWSGCSARTTATSSVTTTNSAGSTVTSPSYGIVVNAATAASAGASASATRASSGACGRDVGIGGVVVAGLVGVVAAL